jgi:protein SCO1/2
MSKIVSTVNASPPEHPNGTNVVPKILKNTFIIVTVGLLLFGAGVAVSISQTPAPQQPDRLGTVANWDFIDQDGKAIGSKTLAGRVYVVNFFFTTCVSICPRLMAAMRSLYDRFDANGVPVHLVSITVDPDNDTRAILDRYAQRMQLNRSRWSLATASYDAVRSLVVNGLTSHMGDRRASGDRTSDIGHGSRLILVDANGEIRGHFESTPTGIDAIYDAAQAVLNQ